MNQASGIDLRLPPRPAPMLVRAPCCSNLVLWASKVCDLPRFAFVERDLRTDDLHAATGVGIARDLQGAVHAIATEGEAGVVPRLEHRRVDVDTVDDVVGLVPPTLGSGQLGVDVRRQNAVVEVVVVVLGWDIRHTHLAQPLDHAPTDASRKQRAQWGTMVRGEELPVLLEGQQHVALAVEGPADGNGRAVRACLSLGQLALRPLEVHILMLLTRLGDAEGCQNVAQMHPSPNAVGHPGSTPMKANGLLRHILLLAPIASTDEGHWDAHDWADLSGCQLVHGELTGVWNSGDLELVVLP
mmetsp:Transcript_118044/g.378381  ORF Transcript_118044/g.378381 Transcript_118044/m.378381 type:complete len:299 (-) Transcript_118044:476-1372(-)